MAKTSFRPDHGFSYPHQLHSSVSAVSIDACQRNTSKPYLKAGKDVPMVKWSRYKVAQEAFSAHGGHDLEKQQRNGYLTNSQSTGALLSRMHGNVHEHIEQPVRQSQPVRLLAFRCKSPGLLCSEPEAHSSIESAQSIFRHRIVRKPVDADTRPSHFRYPCQQHSILPI